jgi:hypothetical protein
VAAAKSVSQNTGAEQPDLSSRADASHALNTKDGHSY